MMGTDKEKDLTEEIDGLIKELETQDVKIIELETRLSELKEITAKIYSEYFLLDHGAQTNEHPDVFRQYNKWLKKEND